MKAGRRWLGLLGWIGLCLGAASLGAWATTPEIDGWYRTLAKPSWNPPNWVFGPVWTTLFLMMAISAWLIWKPGGFRAAWRPLSYFMIQLGLNVAWSWIFFFAHAPGWAFVEILFLWVAIGVTTVSFFQLQKIAGWLLLPYWAWVTFAALLNFVIWRMNIP